MKARAIIIDAFWQLYRENSIKHITVTELMNKAGYHRSVFYQYFKDIYDLLEQEQGILFEALDNLCQDTAREILNKDFSPLLIEKINDFSLKYNAKLNILLKHNEETNFKTRFNNILRRNLYSLLNLQKDDIDIKLALEVYISGQLETYMYFHKYVNTLDFKDYLKVMKSIFQACLRQIEQSKQEKEENSV